MPTLLTNRKMHPTLAARLEEGLGRRTARARSAIYQPRVVALARLLVAVAAVSAGAFLYVSGARARARFEQRRAAVIDAHHAQARGIGPSELAAPQRAEAAIQRLAAPWAGDLVAPELRARGLPALLDEPAIYARGALDDVARGRPVAAATRDAPKDALAYCLFDPPAARDEQTVVAKVLAAREPRAMDARAPRLSLLRDAEEGLPLLAPAWLARVKLASTNAALARLEEALARAPIDAAKRAARARYLLAALDEGAGGNELEGDRPHDVRVALIDLATGEPLLRVRRRVDPAWVSPLRRARYSVELDGCALALDVREAVGAAR